MFRSPHRTPHLSLPYLGPPWGGWGCLYSPSPPPQSLPRILLVPLAVFTSAMPSPLAPCGGREHNGGPKGRHPINRQLAAVFPLAEFGPRTPNLSLFFFLVAKTVALVAAVQMLQRPIKQGPPPPYPSPVFRPLGIVFPNQLPRLSLMAPNGRFPAGGSHSL